MPRRQSPAEWIESHVVIPDNGFNPEPGKYNLDRTPYWRGVLDLLADPSVREVWVYKANQIGFTQLMLAWAGYCAAQDPGAMGILMPDEDSVNELFCEEFKPLILSSPTLRSLRSSRAWDETKHELHLTTMPILGLYAGSASKLEKRKFRYVIGDEINLYRDMPGQTAVIPKLLVRTTTWGHRGKAIFGSKPTTPDGNITRGYESCPDKRRYMMPCPRCGRYQVWQWFGVRGFKDAPGVDKYERANWVRLNKPCHYECEHCHGQIEERERMECVRAGRWVSGTMDGGVWSPTQSVDESGNVTGARMESERVGMWVPGLVSPWLSMHQLAAEFIEAEGDHDKTRTFRNSRLALPWDEIVKKVRPSAVQDKKSISGKPGIVPKWAVALFAAFDTQKDWFAGTIRAWGFGYKSALVWHGELHTFDDVYTAGLETEFELEGGGKIKPHALLIDSGGNRTDEVYEFALRDPRIIPTKGASHKMHRPWHMTTLKSGVQLRIIDTGHYKDMLSRLIGDPDPTKWLPHADVSESYCLEMSSEHKVEDPRSKKQVWKPTGSGRQEAWDCEVLQVAAADMANVGVRQPDPESAPAPASARETVASSPVNYRGRW